MIAVFFIGLIIGLGVGYWAGDADRQLLTTQQEGRSRHDG